VSGNTKLQEGERERIKRQGRGFRVGERESGEGGREGGREGKRDREGRKET